MSVIHNCGTLCYSFSFNKQTDETRRDGGFGQGGIDREIGKRQIVEGGCEETFRCLSQT